MCIMTQPKIAVSHDVIRVMGKRNLTCEGVCMGKRNLTDEAMRVCMGKLTDEAMRVCMGKENLALESH